LADRHREARSVSLLFAAWPVEFLRRGGFLVEPVEVADVLAGLVDDARIVVVAVAFVPGYDGTRIECLDDVEGRQPVPGGP
jgi:hypothetical protein